MIGTSTNNNSQLKSIQDEPRSTNHHRKTSSIAKSYDSNAPPVSKQVLALQELIKDRYNLLDHDYLQHTHDEGAGAIL
jgi:hypothetical protein